MHFLPSKVIINANYMILARIVRGKNSIFALVLLMVSSTENQEIGPREVPRIGRVLKIYINHLPTTSIHPV